MRNKRGVGPRVCFVEGLSSPTAAIQSRERSKPATVAMPWSKEALKAAIFKAVIPELFPIARAPYVLLVIFRLVQCFCHESYFEIVRCVLDLLRSGPVNSFERNIAKLLPILKSAAALLQLIFRRDLGVVFLGFVGGVPIDSFQVP